MTDQEMRIKIAEVCGFKCTYRKCADANGLLQVIRQKGNQFWDKYKVRNPEEDWSTHTLPDFLNDLNAMHEAEKSLKDRAQWEKYSHLLAEQTTPALNNKGRSTLMWSLVGNFIHATALQRAKAFCSVLDTFPPDPPQPKQQPADSGPKVPSITESPLSGARGGDSGREGKQ